MGNLCNKESPAHSDSASPFAHPGQVLNPNSTGASAQPRAKVPQSAGPGRTLGGAGEGNDGGGASGGGGKGGEDAGRAAARAAEERALRSSRATPKQGKLAQNLAREKARTGSGTLVDASREERRRRQVDHGEEVRRWE